MRNLSHIKYIIYLLGQHKNRWDMMRYIRYRLRSVKVKYHLHDHKLSNSWRFLDRFYKANCILSMYELKYLHNIRLDIILSMLLNFFMAEGRNLNSKYFLHM